VEGEEMEITKESWVEEGEGGGRVEKGRRSGTEGDLRWLPDWQGKRMKRKGWGKDVGAKERERGSKKGSGEMRGRV
jgi:hypothetical protein